MPAVPCSHPSCRNTTVDPSGRCHVHAGRVTYGERGELIVVPPPVVTGDPSDLRAELYRLVAKTETARNPDPADLARIENLRGAISPRTSSPIPKKISIPDFDVNSLPTDPSGDPVTSQIVHDLSEKHASVDFDSTIAGTKVRYTISNATEGSNLYAHVDNPVEVSITTAAGDRVPAFDYGARNVFTFADGETRQGLVWPMDAEENAMQSKMTSAEYDVLAAADRRGEDAGMVDNFDGWDHEPVVCSAILVDRVRALAAAAS